MPINISSASLTLSLPANALVRVLKVNVQADPAGPIKLSEVGQVRLQTSTSAAGSQGTSAVIDFGAPITLSAVEVPAGLAYKIVAVYRWQGDSFDIAHPVFANANGAQKAEFPEISSARVQVELNQTVAQVQPTVGTVLVTLPSIPTDLELRVNGGAVVWRYPGPRGTPPADGWVAASGGITQKEVDLTEVIAPLLGNPENFSSVPVTVELRARIPGKLAVVTGTTDYDLLEKVPVYPEPNLVFEQEGDQPVPLFVSGGAGTALKEVWLTVASAPPKERSIPPVGPDRVTEVELVLDSSRSACVRFPENILADLTAVRLPLRALEGGAEVRAQLLESIVIVTPPSEEPGSPLDGPSVTQPVELEPPPAPRGGVDGVPSLADTWTLLPFSKPVPIKGPVWVSLQVTRGTVRWSLAKFGESDGPPYPVRRGAPTGPWLELPQAVLQLPGLGGRMHVIGHPPKTDPLAPLQLQVLASTPPDFASDVTDVTPTAKGVQVKLLISTPGVTAQWSWLRVISLTETTVTIASLIRVVAKP